MTTLLALAMISQANYTLTSLKGNVYIEEQSKVHLYHETCKLVIGINFTANDQRLTSIDTTIRLAETACNNECPPWYELRLARNRYNRLRYKNTILMKILGSNCKLYNNYDLLYLGNTIKYNTCEYFNVTYDIQYSVSDLASLENRLIQLPKIVDDVELQQARLSLDNTENMLNSIVQHRRIKTTTETIMEYLSYLGYASLRLVRLYISYRFGLFEMLENCIPKKCAYFALKLN